MTGQFTDAEYEKIREGARRSAEIVVREIRPRPSTVVDVGCGEAWWAKAFLDAGADAVQAWDYEQPELRQEGVIYRLGIDLEEPGWAEGYGPFDLAVCLEVGEHLHPSAADTLIRELCSLSDTILWSAAIPAQTGLGHVNEQWPVYWAEKFAANGFGAHDPLWRWDVWDDDRVEPWYRQNLMVYRRGMGWTEPVSVVHPALFLSRHELWKAAIHALQEAQGRIVKLERENAELRRR